MIATGSRDFTLRVLHHVGTDDVFNMDDEPSDDSPFFMHALTGHTSSVRAIAGHGNVLVSGL